MNTMLKGLALMSAFAVTAKDAKDQKDERGVAFTEYVVLLAIIVTVVVGLLWALRDPLAAAIADVAAILENPATSQPAT